jgi:hypothetical protein
MPNESYRNDEVRENLISLHQLRAAIGTLGIALPLLLIIFNWNYKTEVDAWCGTCFWSGDVADWRHSISMNYYTPLGHIFTGIMFLFSSLLFTYRGDDKWDNRLANIAACCAPLVALSPCNHCFLIVRLTHYISAVALLTVFGFFATHQFRKPTQGLTLQEYIQKKPNKKKRNKIYLICGWIIFVSLACCIVSFLLAHFAQVDIGSSIFIFETTMLTAFGVSWIVKSKTMLNRWLGDIGD